MNYNQYRRLLLVLTIPLLIAGAIFALIEGRSLNDATILCVGDNCRTTDGLGKRWDTALRSEHEAWFDVNARTYDDNTFPRTIISASSQLVTDATIIDVEPYVGTDDRAGSPLDQLRNLQGKNIALLFGVKGNNVSTLKMLTCNELNLMDAPTSYTAGLCGIPNGIVRVKFRVDSEANKQLSALKTSIENETSESRNSLILNYIFGVPIFFVIFIILSLLVFVIRKSINYIKAG